MQSSPMRLFRGTGGGLETFGRLVGERADALTGVVPVAAGVGVAHSGLASAVQELAGRS
jgi:hypothetical protein